MSSFSDRELIWTEQFLGWENTKQSGKAQMTVSARKRCRIGTGKQAMEAETRSRPVSIALLLKLASSQTENEREKQSDSSWSWADDGQRKERCQLKDKARATRWERGERQALSPGRVMLSWAKGSWEVRPGGDHTSNHTCRARMAGQPSCSCSCPDSRGHGREAAKPSQQEGEGEQKSKGSWFCLSQAWGNVCDLCSPTTHAPVFYKIDMPWCLTISDHFFNNFYPFSAQASQSTGMITPPCPSLQRFDP